MPFLLIMFLFGLRKLRLKLKITRLLKQTHSLTYILQSLQVHYLFSMYSIFVLIVIVLYLLVLDHILSKIRNTNSFHSNMSSLHNCYSETDTTL